MSTPTDSLGGAVQGDEVGQAGLVDNVQVEAHKHDVLLRQARDLRMRAPTPLMRRPITQHAGMRLPANCVTCTPCCHVASWGRM